MADRLTNKLVAVFSEDGIEVRFVDLTTKKETTQPIPQGEPPARGFDLKLSEKAKEDPNLRTMASQCAIYGLRRRTTEHTWGE